MRAEDILILELCRRKRSQGVIEEILQKSKINIDVLLSRIDRHLIEPFILNELVRYPMPEELKTKFAAAAKNAVLETVLRNQMLKKEYDRIRNVLNDHGVECLLMKGLSLDFTGIRTIGDLDILVREKDLLVADRLVPLAGYNYIGDKLNLLIRKNEKKDIALQLDWNSQFQYYNNKNALLLELHTNLFERARVYQFDLDKLLDNIDIFWGRREWNEALHAYVMCAVDLLILMCLHAALKRSLYTNMFVMRTMLDIDTLIDRGIDWSSFLSTVIQLDVAPFILFSLSLAGRLLGTEVPGHILEQLDLHCTRGQSMLNAIHLKCFHDLGSSWLFYANLYKILIPFVYQKKWLPRLKSILLVNLIFPPKSTMAGFFRLSPNNPLVYATYLLNPYRLLYKLTKRMISFFR